jgi:hypothetical protein
MCAILGSSRRKIRDAKTAFRDDGQKPERTT